MTPRHMPMLLALLPALAGSGMAGKPSSEWLPCPRTAAPWDDPVTFDRSRLAGMAPLDAIAAYWGQVDAFKYRGLKGDFTRQLEEAAEWLARNPKVREHFESFFEEVPSYAENSYDREAVFSILAKLPAEWSVRLLAKLSLDPEPVTSPTMSEKEFEHYLTGGGLVIRNDEYACLLLLKMKFSGAPRIITPTATTKAMAKMRIWLRDNESRLDEVAKETWGERAVLDADMESVGDGGGREAAPGKRSGPPDRTAKPAGGGPPAEEPGEKTAIPSWPVAAALAAGLILVALALRFLRRPPADKKSG